MVQLVKLLYMMNSSGLAEVAAIVTGALLLEDAGVNYLLLEGGSDKLLLQ